MFRSVIEPKRAGRLGTGVWVSIGVHAALFVAVLFISARPSDPPVEPEKEYVLKLSQGPNLAKGTPAPAAPKAAAPKPRPPKRDRIPTQVQPLPADPQPVEPDPGPSDSGDTDELANTGGEGVVGGHPDGDPNSTAIGVPLIPNLVGGPGGTGTEVLPFGSGMTPPVLLGGQNIDYTPEARVARVEGTLIAKCVITVDGSVRDCRVIKGLAHMDAAVVEALHSRRYRPVTFQNRPVSVSYVFTIRLKLPR